MQGIQIEEGFCGGTGINGLSCYLTSYQRCHVSIELICHARQGKYISEGEELK
jgi:hypothetical protein